MTLFRLLTLALMAIILVPSGAHLFELPGKIGLDREPYFVVQRIYAGWAFFAVPIFAAILCNVALYLLERRSQPAAARWALVSAGLVVLSLGIFFAWIFPANQATGNWTVQPENWADLRRQWEYGHAVNAVIVLLAFLAACLATIRRRRGL